MADNDVAVQPPAPVQAPQAAPVAKGPSGLDGLVKDPDFLKLNPADQRDVMSRVAKDPDFAKLSDSDTSTYIQGHQTSIGFTPPKESSEGASPNHVRAAHVKQMAPNLDPNSPMATLGIPKSVLKGAAKLAGPVLGEAVGGPLGAGAAYLAEKGITEPEEVAAHPIQTGIETAATVAGPAILGKVGKMAGVIKDAGAEASAASSAAEAETKSAASKVADIASEATDDGKTVDAGKTITQMLKAKTPAGLPTLSAAEKDEFIDHIQPLLTKAQQDAGIKNITQATPREVLKYRDAAMDALSDPKFANYKQHVYDAITKDLRTAVPDLAPADSTVGMKSKVLQAASKLSSVADDAIAPAANDQSLRTRLGKYAGAASDAAGVLSPRIGSGMRLLSKVLAPTGRP